MLVMVFWIGLLIILAFIIHGTIVKNRLGINRRPVSCPNCATMMSRVRMPASISQALWGGFTCPKCGCEMDKWGRKLSAP